MSEQTYFKISDLRTIRHVTTMLREVIPENNKHVPREEYQTVMALLHKWQDELFAQHLTRVR